MRILIVTTGVPFVRGGAEVHAEGLQRALTGAGHDAELVYIPFKWYPPERVLDHMLACRLFDLTECSGVRIDAVIGLKFPAYYVPHPNKILWILHQHRQAYDLWDRDISDLKYYPNGFEVREAIREADKRLLPEAKQIYTNSLNVSKRLKHYCTIDSTPLYHPPHNAGAFYRAEAAEYLFFPSRITALKRQMLVLEALALARNEVRVRFSGVADHPPELDRLKKRARELNVSARVEWLGWISEEEKIEQYAHTIAVLYPVLDEDYGYVTLEAMLSGKPVITCTDSGGPNEFVVAGQSGFVIDPTPDALARAMDEAWENRAGTDRMGRSGYERYSALGISWENVVRTLLS